MVVMVVVVLLLMKTTMATTTKMTVEMEVEPSSVAVLKNLTYEKFISACN